MKCAFCGSTDTKVVDKRQSGEDGEVIRRRRECLACERRFTTYERVEMSPIMVVKKDGTRERYNRNKLIEGIMRACEKRPVSHEQIEDVADKIESYLRKQEKSEFGSRMVGNAVMRYMKKLDKVAYIRFASVYRDFSDIESFMKEIELVLRKKKDD